MKVLALAILLIAQTLQAAPAEQTPVFPGGDGEHALHADCPHHDSVSSQHAGCEQSECQCSHACGGAMVSVTDTQSATLVGFQQLPARIGPPRTAFPSLPYRPPSC